MFPITYCSIKTLLVSPYLSKTCKEETAKSVISKDRVRGIGQTASTFQPQPAIKKADENVRLSRNLELHFYPSFASIVIFALSTFETGHPAFAFCAAVLNASALAPGTFATTSRCTAVIAHPASSFSIVNVAEVLMLSGVRFAPPSCADSAIEKHAACAAAISSSGFVPGVFSNRVVNE